MGEERLFPVLLSLAQRVLKRHTAAVVRDFGIEPFERLLHLRNALGELLPLLDQNGLARTDRSLALLEKGNVLVSASIWSPAPRIHLMNSTQPQDVSS